MELQHNILVRTLVEVKWDEWLGDGACWKVHARLWVVAHQRDCDGTPLYSLSRYRDPPFEIPGIIHHGFAEESLTPVLVTMEVMNGVGALEWKRDEEGNVVEEG